MLKVKVCSVREKDKTERNRVAIWWPGSSRSEMPKRMKARKGNVKIGLVSKSPHV